MSNKTKENTNLKLKLPIDTSRYEKIWNALTYCFLNPKQTQKMIFT